MQKMLFILGSLLIVLAVAWPVVSQVGFGRLPGDIVIRRKGVTIYFPLTTMILISIVFTVILSALKK